MSEAHKEGSQGLGGTGERVPHSGKTGIEKPVVDFDGISLQEAIDRGLVTVPDDTSELAGKVPIESRVKPETKKAQPTSPESKPKQRSRGGVIKAIAAVASTAAVAGVTLFVLNGNNNDSSEGEGLEPQNPISGPIEPGAEVEGGNNENPNSNPSAEPEPSAEAEPTNIAFEPLNPNVQVIDRIEVTGENSLREIEEAITPPYTVHQIFQEMADTDRRDQLMGDYFTVQDAIERSSYDYRNLENIQSNLALKSDVYGGDHLDDWREDEIFKAIDIGEETFEVSIDELNEAKDDPAMFADLLSKVYAGQAVFGTGENPGLYSKLLISSGYLNNLDDESTLNDPSAFWLSKEVDAAMKLSIIGTDQVGVSSKDLAQTLTSSDKDVIRQSIESPSMLSVAINPIEARKDFVVDAKIIHQQTANHSNPMIDPVDGNNFTQFIYVELDRQNVDRAVVMFIVTPGVEDDHVQFIPVNEFYIGD